MKLMSKFFQKTNGIVYVLQSPIRKPIKIKIMISYGDLLTNAVFAYCFIV